MHGSQINLPQKTIFMKVTKLKNKIGKTELTDTFWIYLARVKPFLGLFSFLPFDVRAWKKEERKTFFQPPSKSRSEIAVKGS